nr:MAG TPA: hypothetical protein [Caudoviricetes sp.]
MKSQISLNFSVLLYILTVRAYSAVYLCNRISV